MKERDPRLFSYIVEWDAGLAPNPWWEKCTLAVCKPQIRKSARDGDWIVGLTPKRLGYGLVYAMRVDELLSFEEYFKDIRFEIKKPNFEELDERRKLGDNFYKKQEGEFVQSPSAHSKIDGSVNEEHLMRDLSGLNVLLGAEYFYFGKEAKAIPENFYHLKVRRGHRCNFTLEETLAFLRYLENLNPGINGEPRDFNKALNRLKPLTNLTHRFD